MGVYWGSPIQGNYQISGTEASVCSDILGILRFEEFGVFKKFAECHDMGNAKLLQNGWWERTPQGLPKVLKCPFED